MDGHGGGGGDEGVLGADRQGDADRMSAAQDQGHGGLFHAGDHLRNGKTGLNVAADGVQQEQQPIDLLALLDVGQQRQDVLVFGGLGVFGQNLVALHLADDGEGVDAAVFGGGEVCAQLRQSVLLLFVLIHGDSSRCVFVKVSPFSAKIPVAMEAEMSYNTPGDTNGEENQCRPAGGTGKDPLPGAFL